jgi:flagellar motor switch protein FliM
MSQEFVTREEVDALLNGVAAQAEPAAAAADAARIRPYNLAAQDRVVRGRMPALELVNERFGRLLRVGLFNFMRRGTDVSVGPVRVVKFGDFVQMLDEPTNINLVQVKPLRGTALFIFAPSLVFVVVDTLFGGGARLPQARADARELTPTEQRIIQRLLAVVFEDYERSWAPVHPLKFEYLRSEMNPRFATIAAPHEIVVVTTLRIELGPVGGEFHICIPYQMLQPLRELLYNALPSTPRDADARSLALLARQVKLAEVELTARLAEIPATLRQVLNMKVGDVIPIDIPQDIVAHVDGVPVMECKYGIFNGQYALKVARWITAPAADLPTGDPHV